MRDVPKTYIKLIYNKQNDWIGSTSLCGAYSGSPQLSKRLCEKQEGRKLVSSPDPTLDVIEDYRESLNSHPSAAPILVYPPILNYFMNVRQPYM